MPRFKTSLKKLDGKVVLEVPRKVAKSLGFDGDTEVLVDCKMVSTEKGHLSNRVPGIGAEAHH